jgi:GDP-4-dehydro-6-deoxy-D-mannose reductase
MAGRGGAERVLVTGSAGFVGSHLIDFILEQPGEIEVHGLERSADNLNLAHLQADPRLKLHQVDLNDRAAVTELLVEVRPDKIFHLAARSFVGPAIADPATTLNNNTNATLHLFEAVRAARLIEQAFILNVGSGDQYGFIQPDELPVRENNPFRPGNPYAVSKITQEMLGYQYFRSYGLKIVATRAFNHVGPRQSTQLAASAFAQQIALAEAGKVEPIIRVGNLEASRDYTDVRDVVRGYWLALATPCEPGEVYNICSGQSRKMAAVLELLLEMAQGSLAVVFDPARARPSDVPVVYGDYSKFQQATGWRPEISLEQSLRDLLNYWREQVRSEE